MSRPGRGIQCLLPRLDVVPGLGRLSTMEAEGLHRHMQILGGGDAAYYRAVTVSPPDINTPRVSRLYILNVFDLRFGLVPVKSLHISLLIECVSVAKPISVFYALLNRIFPF